MDQDDNTKDDNTSNTLSGKKKGDSHSESDDDSDGGLLVPTGKTTLSIDEKDLPTLPKREKRRLRLSV